MSLSTVDKSSAAPAAEDRSGSPRRNRKTLRDRLRRDWALLVMVTPAAIVVLLFHYLPALGNVIAFQDYNPWAGDTPLEAFLGSEWIGFGNFEALFGSPAFWHAVLNTFTILVFQ